MTKKIAFSFNDLQIKLKFCKKNQCPKGISEKRQIYTTFDNKFEWKNKIIILSKATVNKFKQTNFMSKNVSKEEF